MHQHAHHSHTTPDNLRTAFFLNLGFTLLEVVGGLWTNSVAILSDALHDLGDSLSLGMAWYLQRVSRREADSRYSYGYGRFSLLGALTTAVVLVVGSMFVIAEAIPRLIEPEPSNAPGMILFAVIGVAVNGLAVLRLRGDRSLNAQTVAWHLLEDVLGWIAVLVVGLTLLFFDFYLLDPILSLLITLYVLGNVLRNLRKTVSLFLQATPDHLDLGELTRRLEALPHVLSTHHTHVWSLDGEHHVLTTHLVVDDHTTKEEVMRVKREGKLLVRELDVDHVTVEVEFESEECGMRQPRSEPQAPEGADPAS